MSDHEAREVDPSVYCPHQWFEIGRVIIDMNCMIDYPRVQCANCLEIKDLTGEKVD